MAVDRADAAEPPSPALGRAAQALELAERKPDRTNLESL
jgi:hypothetical protein